MSTAEWIAKRRELLAAATEGPWRASLLDGVRYEDGSSSYRCGIYPGAAQGPPPVFVTNGIDARDAALIADAQTSLPLALEALEAVLGEASALEAMADEGLLVDDLSKALARLAARGIRGAIEAALRAES